MTSSSLSMPLRRSQKRGLARISVHAPPLRSAAIVFIAVLILFRWLHFILALEIGTTGRQIQLKTDQLLQVERANAMLQHRISEAQSPRLLAERATSMGYLLVTPLYIAVDRPIASLPFEASSVDSDAGTQLAGSSAPNSLPRSLEGAIGVWLEEAPAP